MNRIEPVLLGAALGIFSLLDLNNTVEILGRGGVEVNPFLAALIEVDIKLFITFKLGITLFSSVVLTFYADRRLFNIVTVYEILAGCVFLYALLMIYQGVLLVIG